MMRMATFTAVAAMQQRPMWITIKRFINYNAQYLAETLLYLLLAYVITLAVYRVFVGPFTSESERRHGETSEQFHFRYVRLIEEPNYLRRRRWRRFRGAIVWIAFLFGAVPYIVTRGHLIY